MCVCVCVCVCVCMCVCFTESFLDGLYHNLYVQWQCDATGQTEEDILYGSIFSFQKESFHSKEFN